MTPHKLAFVGGGNMACNLIGGLIQAGWQPQQIAAADPSDQQRQKLADRFGIVCDADNSRCIADADSVVLAVKPQCFQAAATSIAAASRNRDQLFISIAAGIPIDSALGWLGEAKPFVRAMPNTPCLINQGISGLFANRLTSPVQRALAEKIMSAVGAVVWLEREDLLDSVTGISGSGPAYFFKLTELMMESAYEHGLTREQAKKLVLQTLLGAALLANRSEHSIADLRKQITSPNGTTEAALNRMQQLKLEAAIKGGIDAAIDRAKSLSRESGTGQ